MTFFPSSELLLDPSPLRVSNTLPGQLARSTARELALQRSRAPRPFATRGAGAGAGMLVLAAANEAWNLLLSQNIPVPAHEYPLAIPVTPLEVRVVGSFTILDRRPPPFDVTSVRNIDQTAGIPATVIAVGIFYTPSAPGLRDLFSIGVRLRNPDGSTFIFLFAPVPGEAFDFVSLDSLSVTAVNQPGVPLPAGIPTSSQQQQDDTQDQDQSFPISLPGGIPGSLMPIRVPIIVPRPADLGERPVTILYPTTIPAAQRRGLPQMWLTPTGIQVGRGTQGDPVVTTVHDTITNITNITQVNDYRERIPPQVVTCDAEPPSPADCCDCDEIREIVFEELDKKFPPKRPFSNQTIQFGAAESNTFVLPDFTQWVELTIVVKPPNVRTQTGGADAPEVSYNGWYSFGATAEVSERIPFHYDSISIPIPAGVSAFSYTVYKGGTASVTIGYKLAAT